MALLLNTFWNRNLELSLIDEVVQKKQFAWISGRRRVGKTALLRKSCLKYKGLYHQAIEGIPEQQIFHLVEEWKNDLPILKEFFPKNWSELFNLLKREKLPPLLVFDEFPYWVESDKNLPSILQKWIDHDMMKLNISLIISGSSQGMLYTSFLNSASPLYGRAMKHIHLKPMDYEWFCRVQNISMEKDSSFERFALVGGIPHYWKLCGQESNLMEAHNLYFEEHAPLYEEPVHMLHDEKVTGALPKAMLDFIGRGIHKPGELASRLQTVQGNLSRPLKLLQDLNFICKEHPFGENSRSTKMVLYSIKDPSLLFYYRFGIPLKHKWLVMNELQKKKVLDQHTSIVWEDYCRSRYKCSGRYWENKLEIDLIADRGDDQPILVGECKWTFLTERKKNQILNELKHKYSQSKFSKKCPRKVEFKVYSKEDLPLS